MNSIISLVGIETYLDRYVFAGGIMMVALVPTSLYALGIIIQCFISLRKSAIVPSEDRDLFVQLAKDGAQAGLLREVRERNRSSLARILAEGLRDGIVPSQQKEAELIRTEVSRQYRRVHTLSVIYNVAPQMGLLGTVIGLMQTFNQFTISSDPEIGELSGGLMTAMTTTLWGLGIAVPTYLFFQKFRTRLIGYEEDELPEAVETVCAYLRETSTDVRETFIQADDARQTSVGEEKRRRRAIDTRDDPEDLKPTHMALEPDERASLDPKASTPSPSKEWQALENSGVEHDNPTVPPGRSTEEVAPPKMPS
jgi:biopolymer transport protein ExbB